MIGRKPRIVFQIKVLNDSTQQTGPSQDLKLRIEVGGIVALAIEDYGAAFGHASEQWIRALEVDLNARLSFVYIRLSD